MAGTQLPEAALPASGAIRADGGILFWFTDARGNQVSCPLTGAQVRAYHDMLGQFVR